MMIPHQARISEVWLCGVKPACEGNAISFHNMKRRNTAAGSIARRATPSDGFRVVFPLPNANGGKTRKFFHVRENLRKAALHNRHGNRGRDGVSGTF
jgi:hypothetical protein